jgi:hypothetical protein
MSSAARWVAAALLIGAAAVLLWLLLAPEPSARVGESAAVPLDRGSSVCRPCHPEVFAEWEESYHSKAFTDPEPRKLSDDFRNKDCLPCHAPQPVFETGIGNRTLARLVFLEEGVDCIACHRMHDGVAASRAGVVAPCNPVHEPALASVDHCAVCHDQHNTVGEWRATIFAEQGMDCIACHMAPKERRRPDGSVRQGRDHRSLAAHDPELLATVADVVCEPEAGDVRVSITNRRAGHNFPTDERHRAVDLVTTFADASGEPVAERRERFRNPYRDEIGLVDTQIRWNETRSFLYERPAGAARVRVRLYYKLTPITPDEDAYLLLDREERLP